jgi:thiol-disulfide isomerase/thioredoxin
VRDPLLALAVIAVLWGATWVWLGWRRRAAMRAGARDLWDAVGAGGTEALVLAFTTPDCLPCKTIQRPALDALERAYAGRVAVGEVNALDSPDLARRFGILTVPSTVVIGRAGDVRGINHGIATADRLAAQAGLTPAAGSAR